MKTWKIRKGDGDFIAVKCVETKDDRTFSYDICCMDENHHSRENKESNARLIAAAPDLLSALEYYLEHMTQYSDVYRNEYMRVAKEAIAKAKGEQQ